MKTMYQMLLSAALLWSAPALAQDTMTLFAADGDRITADGAVTFAIVGNTRASIAADGASGRSAASKGVPEAIFADIAAAEPEFLVMMGDHVRSGKKGDYKKFAKAAAPIAGLKVVPVVGDHESLKDPRLEQWAATYPGAGADIGFNRVGSWMWFDIKSEGHIYRFVVLDTNKDALGSRWNEQVSWLPSALEGRFDSLFVFSHHPTLELGGREPQMNPGGVPVELMDMIEERVDLNKVRAMFSAGTHTSAVLRPDGPFGQLWIGAGGGGAPGEDLSRWYYAEAAERNQDVSLEPLYDVSILNALKYWADEHPVPEPVMEQARADGAFEGFRGIVEARHMPTYGWFSVTLDGDSVRVSFRHHLPDGKIEQRYAIAFSSERGWVPGL